MPRLTPRLGAYLPDVAEERARRVHEQRIDQLQKAPLAQARLLRDVLLTNGVNTAVAHGLGRRASVFLSQPREFSSTIGTITEQRVDDIDPRRFVVLRATGWGGSSTVLVDMLVV